MNSRTMFGSAMIGNTKIGVFTFGATRDPRTRPTAREHHHGGPGIGVRTGQAVQHA